MTNAYCFSCWCQICLTTNIDSSWKRMDDEEILKIYLNWQYKIFQNRKNALMSNAQDDTLEQSDNCIICNSENFYIVIWTYVMMVESSDRMFIIVYVVANLLNDRFSFDGMKFS